MTISGLVERERRRLRLAETVAGVLLAAGSVAIVAGASAVLLGNARWLALPRALPFVVWLLLVALVVAVSLVTRRRLRDGGSRRDVALAIEREQGLRRGVLVGALEVEGQGALATRAADAARARLPVNAPLAPALRRDGTRRTLAGAAVGVAGVLVLGVTTPLFGDGLRAVLQPVDAWRGALLPPVRLSGAPRVLVQGAPLGVTVLAPGRSRVFVSSRETGEAWHVDTLAVPDGAAGARWTRRAMRGDLWIVASDGRAPGDSVMVRAADRPFVGGVTLHVTYPAYLARAAETLPVGEPLRLPRGTVLEIAGRASVPLDRVQLAEAGGATYALATRAHEFGGRFVPARSATLRWSASGPGGSIADVPPVLEVEVLPDSAPRVAITAPAGDTVLVSGDDAPFAVTASDDHGIASVVLRSVAADASAAPATVQPIASAVGASWSGTATMDLSSLHLAPGGLARVRAEAVDASPWAQRGVSREIIVKRPTLAEQRDVARAVGDSAVQEARAVAAAQRSLAQRTDEAARAQSRSGSSSANAPSAAGSASPASMNYESAEKARALAQEQRAMQERVQKLRASTGQLEQQLRAAGALDTGLTRRLGEAQALLRQALTPQMQAQMEKLEGAARQMNGEQARDALRDLAQMQQRMREQLDRSAEILKRAAHEGAMQTLADQAADLAQRERALADPARPEQRDATNAATLAAQSKRLRDQMADLKDRLTKDKAEQGAAKTDAAGEHAAKSEAEMRKASNESRPGGSPGASPAASPQRARDAAAEMEQAATAMREARRDQVKEWKQELTAELDQSVQEMMQLAREERALESQARGAPAGADQRAAQSAVAQGVDQARERLDAAAKKSALLSGRSQRAVADAREKVSQATAKVSQATGANGGQQASALGEAADALTKAAAALARDRERANTAGSASGFDEMLKEMQRAAQQQGQINGQAQSLMSMPGGPGGEGAQALARSLARRQRGVADQLEDAGDAAGGDKAAQLAREARQLADQLDGGRLDAGTLARQQQLFRRLLDAGRSLEKDEREDSGKRESKSAAGTDSYAPGDKPAARPATRFRPPAWEELRGLSADERRAIIDYFTRLNNGAQR